MTDWKRGGKQAVLRTYLKLHEGKLGAHWLWCAIEQIANGEPEAVVLQDFGYVPESALLNAALQPTDAGAQACNCPCCMQGIPAPHEYHLEPRLMTQTLPPRHADNAPLGFTSSEKSAWSIGVEHGTALSAAKDENLWCVNILGPDDVLPMPDRATALDEANTLNLYFAKLDEARHEYDPIMRAVVIEYPHSAESHAAGLAKTTAASPTADQPLPASQACCAAGKAGHG